MPRASTDARHAGGAPAGAVLSRSTLMTVRRVLHAYREGWLLEERLAAAARMAAEDACLRGVAAEAMVVALEREWAALDDVRRLAPLDAQALLGRLVTLGIQAYHGRDRAGGRRAPAANGGGPGGARPAA